MSNAIGTKEYFDSVYDPQSFVGLSFALPDHDTSIVCLHKHKFGWVTIDTWQWETMSDYQRSLHKMCYLTEPQKPDAPHYRVGLQAYYNYYPKVYVISDASTNILGTEWFNDVLFYTPSEARRLMKVLLTQPARLEQAKRIVKDNLQKRCYNVLVTRYINHGYSEDEAHDRATSDCESSYVKYKRYQELQRESRGYD